MNRFEKIICFIGGANLKILQKYPHEKIKFIATGIGVFNTAVLSMGTMWFALRSVATQANHFWVVLISLFWGFIIFGIDWGLISTIHKTPNYFRTANAWVGILFRIGVALAISFTVSKPIEVFVFKDYLPVAKREMQVDYQQKLNAAYAEKVDAASSSLSKAESDLLGLNDKEQQAYDNDHEATTLKAEIRSLENRYKILSNEYATLNRESDKTINEAYKMMAKADTLIAKFGNAYSDTKNIEAIKSQYADSINIEKNKKKSRVATLQQINTDRKKKEQQLNFRRSKIEAEYDTVKQVLHNQIARFSAEKDSASNKERIESTKNIKASNVFDYDNLINNIIAIGYLEKWKNAPNAKVGEVEIAKKVSFVSWLLMLVIMIIDTAPIVIKLLINRGCYEEEKEKIAQDNKSKRITDSAVLTQTYPNYALNLEKYQTKLKDLENFTNTANLFFELINKMMAKSSGEIKKTNNAFANKDSQVAKDFEQRSEDLLSAVHKKMFDSYKELI